VSIFFRAYLPHVSFKETPVANNGERV